MAQPPAPIARAYKRKGKLRLYRLSERVRFDCARCGKAKTTNRVGVVSDDWGRMVCNGCYAFLLNEQKQKAKQRAKRPQADGATKGKRRQHRKANAPQPITAKELRQLERRFPGVDRLPSFFRAAGVQVELVRGGRLWINGSQTRPLAWILPAGDRLGWNNVIDQMALEYLGEIFANAVADNARFGQGLRAFLRRSENGFEVMRDEVALAMIHATHGRVRYEDPIYANFLTPGAHWQQLADAVHGAEPELVAEWEREQKEKAAEAEAEALAEAERKRAAARRRIDALPPDVAPELRAACLEASWRIRNERQVAYERAVVLECEYGELTLLPIVGAEMRLLVPFRLDNGTATLSGELLLADRDPLPLLIGQAVADADAVAAWSCALLGFADATCIEPEPTSPIPRFRRWLAPGSPSGRARSARHAGRSPRSVPRRRPWPAHLEPIGHWVRYSGSFVAGHRRRLTDGRTASSAARDRARRVGIVLRPNETWVQPHTRGVPEGLEMRFRWRAPGELGLSSA
jgi:hypothetical protein